MLNFNIKKNSDGTEVLQTDLDGRALLFCAQLNKGSAFTREERRRFKLIGKLPSQIETLDEQVKRAYFQYQTQNTRLRKNMYLHELHESNRVLFYRLVQEYLKEMLPLLYTPLVSTIVKIYSQKFRNPRGLYITYDDRDYIQEILRNRTNPEINLIVVTDGEGVLGIGDQGIGGMEIAVAKLMVYTLLGGINPLTSLPIFLDVGTNNKMLLDDPMYLGWRHKRVNEQQYDEFIEKFMAAVEQEMGGPFIHWEDLGRQNAARVLKHFHDKAATFNDDIQGTAVVTFAAMLTAINRKDSCLDKEIFLIYGGGTAGTGIANQLAYILANEYNMSKQQACEKIWMIDKNGLLFDDMDDLTTEQQPYAKKRQLLDDTAQEFIDLETSIDLIKPSILIGCSGLAGAFHESAIRKMRQHAIQPIIFPLSNPTANAEAHPRDLLEWTDGQALIATGSPFKHIEYNEQAITVSQCNNALIFPAIGLAMIASKAKQLSNKMLYTACQELSRIANLCITEDDCPLLPKIANSQQYTFELALAIAKCARDEKLCDDFSNQQLEQKIKQSTWVAEYLPLELIEN